MDAKTISHIRQQVARQFPEVASSMPSITPQAAAKAAGGPATYLLTFKGNAGQAGGHAISRTVRVVASHSGRILKVTTSR